MGKGNPRKVEKGVLVGNSSVGLVSGGGSGSINIPAGPVFYPSEEEFKDPLEYIYKIRPEAEPYGICKIVPPGSWKPPFALDMDSFSFPTKTQAIHQLQARCASCDPDTFALEYNRFLEEHCGKKTRKKVVFEGNELDLCKLFNAVKRFGGYDKVVKVKKWGEVFRFVRPGGKISECSKHVLSQLYLEHLYDYEKHYCSLNKQKNKSCKGSMGEEKKFSPEGEVQRYKGRRKKKEGDKIEVCKLEESLDQICEQCKSGLHGEVMLLCDRCNKGWHTYCLSPPLKSIPPGNWYCLECVNPEKDSFGFVPGKQFTLEAFRRVADRVKKKWFGSASTSRVQLEKKFWEIVEGSVGEVEVMYGSDLDTSIYGSGFPRQIGQTSKTVEVDTWNKYCASPWNLNNLPRLQGSVLRTVHQNIAGVMVPWLYIGMLFSSFCWHFEDHCFYSMNYHHWGEPKCWYSVPGSEAHAFEKVMRDSLPDLFEVQPDLLFQLVTMLNPSVLQDKGVPVYSIIQEPGNFVITFPRSYHGGFNFGLNCAEAVNFAPADWLPHGGFGAELYRHYHKAAVLSHEELLCVVAKSECNGRISTYLKKELHRIYKNEKTWRECLWQNGVVRSSPMTPRKLPEYVGTEEDPVCIICQQILYLSAVSCDCRPAEFVCLEHWERLCECEANRLCLCYRHTLSDLSDVLLEVGNNDSVGAANNLLMEICPEKAVALAKKVKGGLVTYVQLAEQWILKACKIIDHPYAAHAYVSMIEEAQQFLWAGCEMDPVRDMHSKLIQAQSWAESVRECQCKVKSWSSCGNSDSDRVKMDHINKLLSFSNVPCNEPSYHLLKEYQEAASQLIEEINSALASRSDLTMAYWEILYAKAIELPVDIKESEKLKQKISTVKVWTNSVRMCCSQKAPSSVDVDMLYNLESKIFELELELPEVDMLKDLIKQVESCRTRCDEILKNAMNLEEVRAFLHQWENVTANIPELNLLREYYSDTMSWISRVDGVLVNAHEREDQETVIEELTGILADGSLLQIQVCQSFNLELELDKARCRVKAFKVRHGNMSMGFIQELMVEATGLHIEKEDIFIDVSGRHAVAMHWEEKARHILTSKAQMVEYEDILRVSEDINIILPSLLDVEDAVAKAKDWLMKAKPFLSRDSYITPPSGPLEIDALKELILASKNLKVYLHECSVLDNLLDKCVKWELDASCSLHEMEQLLNVDLVGEGNPGCLIGRFDSQILSMESAMRVGTSLGLAFNLMPELQDSCAALKFCIKALAFSSSVPILKEVEMMLDTAASFPVTYKSSALLTTFMDGLNWLKKAIEILEPPNVGQFEASSVEEVLVEYKKICISSPLIIGGLQDALQNHNLWQEQVRLFFGLGYEDRSWNTLLQLKEHGSKVAFKCEELDRVLCEIEKAQHWKQLCEDIVRPSSAEENPLTSALTEIKDNLERALDLYNDYMHHKVRNSPICCYITTEDDKAIKCSVCNDSFHLQCTEFLFEDTKVFVCPYCDVLNSSKLPSIGFSPLRTERKYLELDKLASLLEEASDLCLWTEERRVLHQVVETAFASGSCLKELVEFSLAYVSKDLDVVIRKMSIVLKVMDVAGVSDRHGNDKLKLAVARNLWKKQTMELLGSTEKPTILRIQHHLKEGLAINIPPEDYFRQKLTEFRDMVLRWADSANKVSTDGGLLGLNKVFELISEGENLPVACENELKLLRDRSMLYCICRRPYDQRRMIACDKCDEWYHFDCVNISSTPRMYVCPACNLHPEGDTCAPSVPIAYERSSGSKFEEPQTPLRRSEMRNSLKRKSASIGPININDVLRDFSGGERLLWRNRKPFRRVARKRSEFNSLSPISNVQDN